MDNSKLLSFYASCPIGLEGLLIDELKSFGATNLREHPTHITFDGDLEFAYKACLGSRLANRIYLCLLHERFESVEQLYQQVHQVEWGWHFDVSQSFVVDCVARKSHLIKHSGFGALKVKDAIVDYFQERYEQRPSIDKEHPDYRVHVIVNGNELKIGIDLAGRSLHQRGYRDSKGRAPIKENLAAAMLLRAGWSDASNYDFNFHDPMCGTGTILIEAAMIATDMAPGLSNPNFIFKNWKQHEEDLWQPILSSAQIKHRKAKADFQGAIIGSDSHKQSLQLARENIKQAGFSDIIQLEEQDFRRPQELNLPKKGLLVTNPPYGERLGDEASVRQLYVDFGGYLKRQLDGWDAAMITTEVQFAKAVGLRSKKQYKFKNGALDCKLYLFEVNAENAYEPFNPDQYNPNWEQGLSDGAVMLKNRLHKNLQRYKSYLKQNNITCFRLYDADLPEYSAAIDIYEDEIHIQEYAAPKEIPIKVTQKRLMEIVRVAAGVHQVAEKNVHLKQRQRQKGTQQYEKQSGNDEFQVVHENGLQFYVNLSRYLDTGLFLDHRKTRKMIMAEADGKDFLNLFAYTGSVSLYAAKGGARTTTVDMSKTYINWGIKNFALNNIPVYGHRFIQADCLNWLVEQDDSKQYDLIFLDPPTFSNSKRMDAPFDVHNDQVELINNTMRLLRKSGKLYFSNNFKKFELSKELSSRYKIQEITHKTLPIDFQKSRNHHRCWLVEHKKLDLE